MERRDWDPDPRTLRQRIADFHAHGSRREEIPVCMWAEEAWPGRPIGAYLFAASGLLTSVTAYAEELLVKKLRVTGILMCDDARTPAIRHQVEIRMALTGSKAAGTLKMRLPVRGGGTLRFEVAGDEEQECEPQTPLARGLSISFLWSPLAGANTGDALAASTVLHAEPSEGGSNVS